MGEGGGVRGEGWGCFDSRVCVLWERGTCYS